jgi:hypothetical protein
VIDPKLVIRDDIDTELSHAPIPGQAPQLKVVSRTTTAPADPQAASTRVLHSYSPLAEHVAARTDTDNESIVASNPSTSSSAQSAESCLMEIQTLKRRVAEMSKENAVLRHELSLVRSKLDQIKKIA